MNGPVQVDGAQQRPRRLPFNLAPHASCLALSIPLAFLIADAVTLGVLNGQPPAGRAGQVWLAGLIQNQLGLLWLWASFGTGRRVIRWAAAIGGTIGLAGVATWAYHDLDEMRAIALGFYSITAIWIVVIMASARVAISASNLDRKVEAGALRPLQFSLGSVFETAAVVCLLAFLLRTLLLPVSFNSNVNQEIVLEAPVAMLFSAVALLSIWGVWGQRLRLVPWVLLTVAVWMPQLWPVHIPCAGSPANNSWVVALTILIESVSLFAWRRSCKSRDFLCSASAN